RSKIMQKLLNEKNLLTELDTQLKEFTSQGGYFFMGSPMGAPLDFNYLVKMLDNFYNEDYFQNSCPEGAWNIDMCNYYLRKSKGGLRLILHYRANIFANSGKINGSCKQRYSCR
ncbi:MAG: hypothetical protein QXL94_07600, partial [Candidatus Parvarchaeum sp.]